MPADSYRALIDSVLAMHASQAADVEAVARAHAERTDLAHHTIEPDTVHVLDPNDSGGLFDDGGE